MLESIPYGICFLLILTDRDVQLRIMAGVCLAYILIENFIFYYCYYFVYNYDITLYLSVVWALDSILLFTVACVFHNWKKKLLLATALPLLLAQVFVVQYPQFFPDWVYVSVISHAHNWFIETFIGLCAFKDATVKEWLRTSSIIFMLIIAHMM